MSEGSRLLGNLSAADVRRIVHPDPAESALHSVRAERRRQEQLWGEQNHTPLEWLGILQEEIGEFARHANEGHWHPESADREALRKEIVHVAAVALAIIECLDRQDPRPTPSA